MNLRSLIVALMLVLAGCATPNRGHEVAAPVLVPESTWRQVDVDIVAASQDATAQAKTYARGSMEYWRGRVYERTEANFIPWFSGYWTQEWLSIKVTWYEVSKGAEADSAAKRLAVYLQQQYHDRVLDPVAKETDPDAVLGQATEFYVQLLSKQLQDIAQRHRVPQDQFDRRLNNIPAITLAPPPARSASLYQIVHADPMAKLPAYVALNDRIHNAAGGSGAGSSDAVISSVAKKTSERLEAQFASRGAAGAAAAVAGKVAGLFISVGVAGVRAIVHEGERPEMEAQLRQNLNVAFDNAWRGLVEDRSTGVMAGVYYLSGEIEGSLAPSLQPPMNVEPEPQGVPLPGEQSVQQDAAEEGGAGG